MSNISDTQGVGEMPFEEKFTWVSLLAAVAVAGVYFALVLSQLASISAAQIAYQVPMLVAIGVYILLTIVGTIMMGIGTGVSREISKVVSGEGSTEDIGRSDERDLDIRQRGQLAGSYAAAAGAAVALGLAMIERDYFWIANALYLGFVASSVVAAIVKLVAYRRGF